MPPPLSKSMLPMLTPASAHIIRDYQSHPAILAVLSYRFFSRHAGAHRKPREYRAARIMGRVVRTLLASTIPRYHFSRCARASIKAGGQCPRPSPWVTHITPEELPCHTRRFL
jgi:hypothetical protein